MSGLLLCIDSFAIYLAWLSKVRLYKAQGKKKKKIKGVTLKGCIKGIALGWWLCITAGMDISPRLIQRECRTGGSSPNTCLLINIENCDYGFSVSII